MGETNSGEKDRQAKTQPLLGRNSQSLKSLRKTRLLNNGMERLDRKFCDIKLDDSTVKVGAFSGYGAIFGNEDAYGDVIERGAFSTSLQEWKGTGKLPPMLLQHGGGFMGGADDLVPI